MARKIFRSRYIEEAVFSDTALFITPMLDMAFQILTFFVFTYHPSALERQFPLTFVPGDQGGETSPTDPNQRASPTTGTSTAFKIHAVAKENGRLASLELRVAGNKWLYKMQQADPTAPFTVEITTPTEREELSTRSNTEDEAFELLLKRLSQQLIELKKDTPNENRLDLQGSFRLRWKESMALMDAIREGKDKNGRVVKLFPEIKTDIVMSGP